MATLQELLKSGEKNMSVPTSPIVNGAGGQALQPTTPVVPVANLNTSVTPPPTPIVSSVAQKDLSSTLSTVMPSQNEILQEQTKQSANNELKLTGDKILELAGMQAQQGSDTLTAQADVGLAAKQEALNKSNIESLRLDQAYEDEVKKIKENQNGLFGGAVEQELQAAQARYLDKKSDIAIDRLAAQGDVDTALKIVEQKIKAKYEPIDNQLKTLQLYYQYAQNDMTESEKLQAQQAFQMKVDERNFSQQKELADYQGRIARQNAAYSASLEQAKAPEVKTINGIDSQWDGIKWVPIEGAQAKTSMESNALTSAQDLLNKFDSGFGTSAVGKSGFLGSFGYALIPGTERADFVTQFDNFKAQADLNNVKYLKGQGQVSDAERRLLSNATKLNLKQSESEFRKSLNAQIALMGGQVTVTMKDKKGDSQKILTDKKGIQQALNDGLTVEY